MSDEESDRETEGEKALKKRREQKVETSGLDDGDNELLQQNKVERDEMMKEIRELRERSERRKKEREIEEKRLAAERAAEDARRKGDEEERKRKKEEEEHKKQRDRVAKMAEFEKWKNPPKANFVISKRLAAASGDDDSDQGEGKGRKSKEQLEAEKRAILKQRIKPLEISGADKAKLAEKLKELHSLMNRLEGEKYDIERRYKTMQGQLAQLAELARQANKVGKDGLKKTPTGAEDTFDKFQERFAGAPSKVEMFSKYERQKDKRTYQDRHVLFTGPQFAYPPDRIKPQKIVSWNEEGTPIYAA